MPTALRLLPLSLLFLLGLPLRATHLVGGELGYRSLGETAPGSGLFRYAVDLRLYLNCGPSSNFQDFTEFLASVPAQTITIGIYDQDPAQPEADKVRTATLDLPLMDVVADGPNLPPGCTTGNELCMLTGTFTATIDLPATAGGHHLYYQLCCRSNGIINLTAPAFTGIAFHAFIPPEGLANSSPTFLDRPQVFLCIGDTSSYLNTATDPDGDVLEYLFATPSNSPQMESGVTPPTLPWPLPLAGHQPDHSATVPFGPDGHAALDPTTGMAAFMPASQGIYTVAVRVNEYRDGQLIASTVRDVEVRGIPCSSGNNAPVLDPATTTFFEASANVPFSLLLQFNDVDGDDLTLVTNGSLLQAAPPAAVSAPNQAPGSVSATLSWTPSCAQASDVPYVLSATATDNACPNASAHALVSILVRPPAVVDTIIGDTAVCADAAEVAYSITNTSGPQPEWTVTGGTLIDGQGTNTIGVVWTTPGTGTVHVSLTDPAGCGVSTFQLEVGVQASPTLDLGTDIALCLGDSLPLGPGGAGSWTWTPADGLSDDTIAQPMASPTATTTYTAVLEVDGCTAEDDLMVTVQPLPNVEAGPDHWTCPGAPATLSGSGDGTAAWTPIDGLDDPGSFTPAANPATSTTYHLTVTDANGCSASDSVTVHVVDVVVDAGADVAICQGDTIQLLATGTPGVTWEWTPAAALSDPTVASPLAHPTATTLFMVTARLDTCSAADSVRVTVQGPPAEPFDLRAEPGCETIRVFLRDNTGAAQLDWDLGDGTIADGPTVQHHFAYGDPIAITLRATDASGCVTTLVQAIPADTLPELTATAPMNVFTPNGDGRNDLFSPLDDHVGPCADLVIMNRWGQTVFVSTGNNVRWDGHDASGQACVPGTYFYTFTLRTLQWNGTVELIR